MCACFECVDLVAVNKVLEVPIMLSMDKFFETKGIKAMVVALITKIEVIIRVKAFKTKVPIVNHMVLDFWLSNSQQSR